jgi:hypothetical protein
VTTKGRVYNDQTCIRISTKPIYSKFFLWRDQHSPMRVLKAFRSEGTNFENA